MMNVQTIRRLSRNVGELGVLAFQRPANTPGRIGSQPCEDVRPREAEVTVGKRNLGEPAHFI
jgi:hypothetical protein